MPKFSLRAALVTVAVLALWLGVNQLDDNFGYSVRQVMWILLFAYPIPCIIYHRGRIQAFWIGFIITLVFTVVFHSLRTLGSANFYVQIPPRVYFASELAQAITGTEESIAGRVIIYCVTDAWILLPCVLMGWLSARMSKRQTL